MGGEEDEIWEGGEKEGEEEGEEIGSWVGDEPLNGGEEKWKEKKEKKEEEEGLNWNVKLVMLFTGTNIAAWSICQVAFVIVICFFCCFVVIILLLFFLFVFFLLFFLSSFLTFFFFFFFFLFLLESTFIKLFVSFNQQISIFCWNSSCCHWFSTGNTPIIHNCVLCVLCCVCCVCCALCVYVCICMYLYLYMSCMCYVLPFSSYYLPLPPFLSFSSFFPPRWLLPFLLVILVINIGEILCSKLLSLLVLFQLFSPFLDFCM